MQQRNFCLESATGRATGLQPMSLKAAAAKVLERSRSRNSDATSPETPRNSGAISDHDKVAPAQHIATAEIERRIRAMAARWNYAPDELAEALTSGNGWLSTTRQPPHRWCRIVRTLSGCNAGRVGAGASIGPTWVIAPKATATP